MNRHGERFSLKSIIRLQREKYADEALALPSLGAPEPSAEAMLAKFQAAEQITEDIKKNDYTYFTAEDTKENKLIGYCGVTHKKDYMLLSKLYVRRDQRGKGIARSLFEEAAALCRQEYGYQKIRLAVNKNNAGAIAVYKKMSFETIDSIRTDIGGGFFVDDFVMEYSVGAAERTPAKQL